MRAIYLAIPFFLLACKSSTDFDEAPKKERATSRPTSAAGQDAGGRYDVFGSKLAQSEAPAVAVVDLVRDLNSYEGKTVRVSGRVESTCAVKGCWMWVRDGGERVFVKFQDYAFFVPTANAENRRVVFEGKVSMRTFTVEQLRHYAKDAGDIEGAKKITEPKQLPFVMATGVRMYDAE